MIVFEEIYLKTITIGLLQCSQQPPTIVKTQNSVWAKSSYPSIRHLMLQPQCMSLLSSVASNIYRTVQAIT